MTSSMLELTCHHNSSRRASLGLLSVSVASSSFEPPSCLGAIPRNKFINININNYYLIRGFVA